MTATPCPSLGDLLSEDPSPEVKSHLEECRRCRSLRAHLETDVQLKEISEFSPTKATTPVDESMSFAPGAVWTFDLDGVDEYLVAVIVAKDDEQAVVAPLSEEMLMASEWDLFLPKNSLGYEAIVEVWNHGTVLPEQAREPLATVPPAVSELLEAFYRAMLEGDKAPESELAGVPVVAEDDPRLLFQDREGERVRSFWEPADVLSESSTIGALVATRRQELGLNPAELAAIGEGEQWLKKLENDKLDLALTVPAPDLAALLKAIGVWPSRRLKTLLHKSAESTYRGEAVSQGLVLARRRRGKVRRKPAASDEERGKAAGSYAGKVIEQMER